MATSGDDMTDEIPDRRSKPESFRARSIDVSLTVRDLRASVAWYCDTLGFTVDREHERNGTLIAVSIKAGAVRILLGQDDGSKGADRVKGEGFSFQLTTAQNIDDIAARIKASGTTLDTEPTDTPWGARVFRVRDPDGFRFAVSSAR
jgi:uncharacterized glyoxalase superfamily protein PhnB